MPNQNYSNLLYPHSPFLAPSSGLSESVNFVLDFIKKKKLLPLHGICHELCNIAETLNLIQIKEYAWIKKSFNSTVDDLDWFFLGYTTPPTIIVSACSMEVLSIKKVIENLTAPTKDIRMTELNRYKVKLLPYTFTITSNHLPSKPKSVLNPVYKVLNESPFTTNPYYQTGVESSKLTAHELSKMVEELLTPLQ